MRETCPIFLRWREGLAKARMPHVASFWVLSHISPFKKALYYPLIFFSTLALLLTVPTAPSHDFPAPTSNPRSLHPRLPHNSWSHVLRWPKSFNMEQRPEPAWTPSRLPRSSQASLHRFLYRSVLCFIPLYVFCLYLDISSSVFPHFQRCLQRSPPR